MLKTYMCVYTLYIYIYTHAHLSLSNIYIYIYIYIHIANQQQADETYRNLVQDKKREKREGGGRGKAPFWQVTCERRESS